MNFNVSKELRFNAAYKHNRLMEIEFGRWEDA